MKSFWHKLDRQEKPMMKSIMNKLLVSITLIMSRKVSDLDIHVHADYPSHAHLHQEVECNWSTQFKLIDNILTGLELSSLLLFWFHAANEKLLPKCDQQECAKNSVTMRSETQEGKLHM